MICYLTASYSGPFFSVSLSKITFTSFIFQTGIAVSRLLASCPISEPVQESYGSLFTGAVDGVLATTSFRIPIASRDEAASAFDSDKPE